MNFLAIHILSHISFAVEELGVGGPCPEAHYCPLGTSYPLGCPSGTYNNQTGRSNCTECPAGYFCPENTTTYEIFPCPVGHYCPPGTKYSMEYPCPRGYYRNLTSGMMNSDCFPCPGGLYCGGEGLEMPTGKCDQGEVRKNLKFIILAAFLLLKESLLNNLINMMLDIYCIF